MFASDAIHSLMEYVPSGSVADCLHKYGKFDAQIARSFIGQILTGLAYLHGSGIIHRVCIFFRIWIYASDINKFLGFENGEHPRRSNWHLQDIRLRYFEANSRYH